MECKKEQITLVLLFCGLRTGHFGQGAFVNKLISNLGGTVKVLQVKTDTANSQELYIELGEQIDTLAVPMPQNGLCLYAENTVIQRKYAQRIASVILPYVRDRSNLVFWANSIDYLNLSQCIKEMLGEAKLLYVHHAWSWKHLVNVSNEEFSKQWRKQNREYHPIAFEYTGYQQKMAQIADVVVPVTKQAVGFMTQVLDIPPSKVKMIYNGIEQPITSSLSKPELKKKYGFDPHHKIILFTGRVKEDKGVGYLVKAFKILASKHNDIRLLIAGNGDLADFISMTSPFWSRITFTGELASDIIVELYELADIGVLPSLHEQCSFTAIEMRFHKLPIIVSSVDGLDEVFEDGVDALQLPVYYDERGLRTLSETELAEKMELLLNDDELCHTLAENSYAKALKYFTAKEMQEKYLEVIQSMVEPIAEG